MTETVPVETIEQHAIGTVPTDRYATARGLEGLEIKWPVGLDVKPGDVYRVTIEQVNA